MIYLEQPEDFNPRFEIVSCLLEREGNILMLRRQDHKPEGDTWGVPAGKVDSSDTSPLEALIREIKEETGILLNKDHCAYFKKVYVRSSSYDFVYHMYHYVLEHDVDVAINNEEHKTYSWMLPEQAMGINLIENQKLCMELFYGTK